MSLLKLRARNHPAQVARHGANDEVDDRATLPETFAGWDRRFGGFTVDVAAAAHNAKCELYFTRDDNGLAQSWGGASGVV